jgi:hypothetical protein
MGGFWDIALVLAIRVRTPCPDGWICISAKEKERERVIRKTER